MYLLYDSNRLRNASSEASFSVLKSVKNYRGPGVYKKYHWSRSAR